MSQQLNYYLLLWKCSFVDYSEVTSDSRKWVQVKGKVKTGTTAYTGKGNLECKNYVVHTVGPIWRGGKNNEDDLLKDAVCNVNGNLTIPIVICKSFRIGSENYIDPSHFIWYLRISTCKSM